MQTVVISCILIQNNVLNIHLFVRKCESFNRSIHSNIDQLPKTVSNHEEYCYPHEGPTLSHEFQIVNNLVMGWSKFYINLVGRIYRSPHYGQHSFFLLSGFRRRGHKDVYNMGVSHGKYSADETINSTKSIHNASHAACRNIDWSLHLVDRGCRLH